MPRRSRSARRLLAARRIWPRCGCRRWPARRLNIVAFPSAAAARQAAVSGNVAAAALGLSNAIGDLREGRLVGLGIAAANRADAFPDMPPLRDSGLDLSAVIRRGLAASGRAARGAGAAAQSSLCRRWWRTRRSVTMPTPTASFPIGGTAPPGRRKHRTSATNWRSYGRPSRGCRREPDRFDVPGARPYVARIG